MSVVSIDEPPSAMAPKRESFWHRLALALDEHFADRSKRAVPATTLRRSRHDIDRCRRLLHKNALVPVGVNFTGISHHRAALARPR